MSLPLPPGLIFMGEIWTEATGLPDPTCNADFEKGFQVLLDDRKLFISNTDRKSKGATRKLFRKICDLAPTIEDLIYVTESAISSNAGFNYILSAFSNGKEKEDEEHDSPDQKPNKPAQEVPKDDEIESDDQIELMLTGLTNEFRNKQKMEDDANPDCATCGGTGYEVVWYPSDFISRTTTCG